MKPAHMSLYAEAELSCDRHEYVNTTIQDDGGDGIEMIIEASDEYRPLIARLTLSPIEALQIARSLVDRAEFITRHTIERNAS